jgi:DNA-binding XRE family transcriptional regulator
VYQIRSSATALRAAAPDRAIGVVLSGAIATAETARAIAPYIDAVWIPVPSSFTPDEVRIRFPGLTCALETTDTDVLAPQPAHVDTRIVRADDIVPTVLLLSALREWLPQGLAALDEVAIDCDGCRSQVWLHPDTLDAIAVVTTQAGGDLRVRPTAIRVAAVDTGTPAPARPLAVTSMSQGPIQPCANGVCDIGAGRTQAMQLEPRQRRHEQQATRADMTKLTGMDRSAVSKLEGGQRPNPTIETLVRYAEAVGKRLVVSLADAR